MVARLTLNQLVQVRVLYPLFFSFRDSLNLRSGTTEQYWLFDLFNSDNMQLKDTVRLIRSLRTEGVN